MDELRKALWDILYWDQDNVIPKQLFKRAKSAIDAYDAKQEEARAFVEQIEALQRATNTAVRRHGLKGEEFHPLNIIDLGLFGLLM